MNDMQRDATRRLQAEVAQLRTALQAVEAPPLDEVALRATFRAVAGRRAAAASRAPIRARPWQTRFAAAAVVAVALGAVLVSVSLRVDRSAPVPPAAAASAAPMQDSSSVSAFQPLPNSPRLLPSSSYSVVRVRIPLAAFALLPGADEQDGMIEADLLVGEDGLARGIRFNEADPLHVSVAGQ